MGWNSTVVIMNDALSDIERNPEQFVKNLVNAISVAAHTNKSEDVRAGSSCNAATVIESHHADSLVPILVGANCGTIMSDAYIGWGCNREESLRRIAESMGFELVKKNKALDDKVSPETLNDKLEYDHDKLS